jgi:hypothetical protein
MQSLPIPEKGGNLDDLRPFVNTDVEGFRLLIFWLLASLNPRGPYPILVLNAEHGCGKSSVTTILQRLVDPQSVEKLAPFKDVDGLFATARARWAIPLDNLSRISPDWSDALCRMSTGSGFSKRALYSNDDVHSISLARPIMLNGIHLTPDRPDLLDRSLIVSLNTISERSRKTESELFRDFEALRPKLLGALCSTVSTALKNAYYRPASLPRLADAASFVLQAEYGGGLPWAPGTIENALQHAENERILDVLSDSLEGSAVLSLMEGKEKLALTARQFLQRVTDLTAEESRRFLPRTPKDFSIALTRLAPLLRHVGIECHRQRAGSEGVRVVILERRLKD